MKKRNMLLCSVSYAVLTFSGVFNPARAVVTVNGTGSELVINAERVQTESDRKYLMGYTNDAEHIPLEQSIGSYILGVANSGETLGSIRMVGTASMSIEKYARQETTATETWNFVRDGNLNMTGGSIINEGSGVLTIKGSDTTLNLSNGAQILSQGAPSGSSESEATNKGALDIQGGTFNMSGTSQIGGSYGTGKSYQETGGLVTISGGTFHLSDQAAIVQKGKGDLLFQPSGALDFDSTSSGGILHSGASGDILIKGGTFTFQQSGGISKGQTDEQNVTEGSITVSGGSLIFEDGASMVMQKANKGDIKFTNANLTARTTTPPEDEAVPFNAVLHKGEGILSFGEGATVNLTNANVFTVDKAEMNISGGTFTLDGASSIGGIFGAENAYTDEVGDVTISNGRFVLSDSSSIVQEGAGSIILKEGSSMSGLISISATATDKTPDTGAISTGIRHTGGSGDIEIKAANLTFTGAGAGIYRGREEASQTTTGNITLSGSSSSITLNNGASIVLDASNTGDFAVSAGSITLAGADEASISSLNNRGTGTVAVSGTADVRLNAYAMLSAKGDLNISAGTVQAKNSSILRSESNINISGGALTLTDSALFLQQGSGSLSISENTEEATVPTFVISSAVAPASEGFPINTGFVHGGSSGNIDVSAGTFQLTGAGAGVYKGGVNGLSPDSMTTSSSSGDINLTGGTWTFADDAKIIMGAQNQGAVNISGGTYSFAGNNTGIFADGGQTINFSGGKITANDTLNINGILKVSGSAVLEGSGLLNFKDGAGAVFDAATTWGGSAVLSGGLMTFNSNVSFAQDFTASGTVDTKASTLTVGGDMTFAGGSTYALTMASENSNGKIVANKVTVGNGTSDKVNLSVTLVRGAAIKDVVRRFTFIETSSALNADQFTISNNRYSFKPGTDCPNDLCYDVEMILGAADVVYVAGGSANEAATATALLDGALFQEGTPLRAVTDKIEALSQHEWGQYTEALAAIAPDPDDAGINTVAEAQNRIIGSIGNRMGEVVSMMNSGMYGRSGGSGYDYGYPASSYYRRAPNRPTTPYRPWEKNPKHYGVWIQGLYNKTELKADGVGKPGFDGNTSGVTMGADSEVAEGLVLGLGYAYTTSDISGYLRQTKITSNSGFLYGFYKPNRFFINGVFSGGQSKVKEEKNVAGTFVNDDYKSNFFAAQVMGGYEMGVFTPSVGLRYSYVNAERHEDSIGQEIKSNDYKTFTGVLEGRLSEQYYLGANFRFRPEVSLAATYDFSRDKGGATVFLPNATSYTIEGRELDKFAAEAGAGVTLLFDNSFEFAVNYKGEFRKDYTNHSVTAKLRYNF